MESLMNEEICILQSQIFYFCLLKALITILSPNFIKVMIEMFLWGFLRRCILVNVRMCI